MPTIEPGREDDWQYWRRSLAVNAALMRTLDDPASSHERQRLPGPRRFFRRRMVRRPVVGSVAAGAGRVLRRAGEVLESWAGA
jgi:hypothetical protein